MTDIAVERDRIALQFNTHCAGRRFLQSDMSAVKRKK